MSIDNDRAASLPETLLDTLPETLSPRLRRRRKLLLASAPVALAALVVAVKLLSLPISAGQAENAYAAGQGEGTLKAGQAMGVLNMVERYKAHFAQGDGHVLRGDFVAAQEQFAAALDLAPVNESCKVRVNLVLTLEKLGEAKEKAGDPASAQALFAQGSDVVAQAPRDCFTPNSENNKDGEGDALKDAQKRLAEKQAAVQGDGQEPPKSGGEAPAQEPAPAGKLEQLQKNGQQAQKERSKSDKLSDELSNNEPEQFAKPW
ncbi:hypothetical protein [Arthrobacter glacialis]|uniref:hypothetical protein n=1 Tax=Arthrobacter glacialis TaxID=1664 RepID=UPI000CD43DC5|nr:hypothetical protein [Arthrobacter glacialis]POH58838.1 hypothetical protein CVS28_08965 [Arthrobacter glacialis]